jgi:hypothetical protein
VLPVEVTDAAKRALGQPFRVIRDTTREDIPERPGRIRRRAGGRKHLVKITADGASIGPGVDPTIGMPLP